MRRGLRDIRIWHCIPEPSGGFGSPPDLSSVRADIDAVVQHWAAEGIEVGSDDALEIDF